MGKTIILILALICTGTATFFGLSNLDTMKDERSKIHRLEKDIDKAKVDISAMRDEIAKRRDEIRVENATKDKLASDQEGLNDGIAEIKRQLPQLDEKVELQKATIKKYEDIIADLKNFFKEMNVNDLDELNGKIKQLASDTVAREKELAETKSLVEAANAANAKLSDTLAAARGRQVERSQGLSLNTKEALILAVNHDWGFVVINAGEAQGFRGDNSLIVKRGDTFIAKLAITSITKTQMVADIVPKSTVEGMAVMPGDHVILEKPNQ